MFERNGDGYVITSKTKLHNLTYQQARNATDSLNADLVCAARNYAADSVKSVVQAWQNGTYATQSTLHYRDGDYYLHVEVAKDDESQQEAEGGTVLGVDLGVKTITAMSTGRIWSGGYLNHRRREYETVHGSLQQTGTESAHRTIVSMGDRDRRWTDDYLHRLSNALVQEAITHDCSTIALEERFPDDPGVEGCGFDPGDRDLREKTVR